MKKKQDADKYENIVCRYTHTNTETLVLSSHLSREQSAAVQTEIREENLLVEKYLIIYNDFILKVVLFPFDLTETFSI